MGWSAHRISVRRVDVEVKRGTRTYVVDDAGEDIAGAGEEGRDDSRHTNIVADCAQICCTYHRRRS